MYQAIRFMYRWTITILLLTAVAPSIRDAIVKEGIVAMLQEAKPEFSRDPKELEELILELEQKSEKDIFERTLLEELKRFQEEIGHFPDLAKAAQTSSL